MRIQFELSKDDLIAYNLFHYARSPTARSQKQKAFVNSALLGLVVWLAPLIVLGPSRERALALSPFLLVVPVALVVLAVQWPRIIRRNIERMIAEGKNRGLTGRKEVTITPVEITAAGELLSATVRWKAVERIEVTPDYAFVYFSALGAVIVPRRAFGSDADFASWVETAREYQADANR